MKILNKIKKAITNIQQIIYPSIPEGHCPVCMQNKWMPVVIFSTPKKLCTHCTYAITLSNEEFCKLFNIEPNEWRSK